MILIAIAKTHSHKPLLWDAQQLSLSLPSQLLHNRLHAGFLLTCWCFSHFLASLLLDRSQLLYYFHCI